MENEINENKNEIKTFSYVLLNSPINRLENILINKKNNLNLKKNKQINENEINEKINENKNEKVNEIKNNKNNGNNKNEKNVKKNKKMKLTKKSPSLPSSISINSQQLNTSQSNSNSSVNVNVDVDVSVINQDNNDNDDNDKIDIVNVEETNNTSSLLPLSSPPQTSPPSTIEPTKSPILSHLPSTGLNSISFTLNNSQRGTIIFLNESSVIHISGMCSLKLLSGRGNINGYTLKLNEDIQIRQPSWTPAVRLFIESSLTQDRNMVQSWIQSRPYYENYSQEINDNFSKSTIVIEIISVDMLKENWMVRCEDFSKYQMNSKNLSVISLSSAIIGINDHLTKLGIESQTLPSNWKSAGDEICKVIKTSPHIFLCGAKGVGK